MEFFAGVTVGLLGIHLVYVAYFHWVLIPRLESHFTEVGKWVEKVVPKEKLKNPFGGVILTKPDGFLWTNRNPDSDGPDFEKPVLGVSGKVNCRSSQTEN